MCYKLLESFVFYRIKPPIDAVTLIKQAGLRPAIAMQTKLQLSSFPSKKSSKIKKRYQLCSYRSNSCICHNMKKKTIIQTLKITKWLTFHKFLNDMLTNLYFTVHIEASQSSTKQLNNGLLQGSVIASTQITCT